MSEVGQSDVEAAVLAERILHGDTALLQAAQISASRRRATWPQRPLSLPVRATLWALRVYLLLMLAAVAVQVARLA